MSKKGAASILILILCILGWVGWHAFFVPIKTGYDDHLTMMTDQFESFNESLKSLEGNLNLLLEKGPETVEVVSYIDQTVADNFWQANYSASKLSHSSNMNPFKFIYSRVNGVMTQITADRVVTVSEKNYVTELANYTHALIETQDILLKDISDAESHEKRKAFEKRIANVYASFSITSEKLLEMPQYAFLEQYEGDFETADFQHAQAVCNTLFSKLVENRSLEFDNRDDVNINTFVFETNKDNWKPITNGQLDTNKNEYRVTYHKITHEITYYIASVVLPSKRMTEKEIDDIANQTSMKIHKDLIFFDKKVTYNRSDKRIENITYTYKKKSSGADDTPTSVEMVVGIHGLVNHVKMIDPSAPSIK